MSNKYNQIMEKIEVTEEMRRRVLHNVEYACHSKKQTAFLINNRLKKMLAVAACFVLVLGLGYLPFIKENTDLRPQITNQIIQTESLQQLSDMVGFEVLSVSGLPFDAQSVTYKAYWNQMAETKYISETNICTVRQSMGTEDISGDYTSYEFEEKRKVNGAEILLKGHSSDSFSVAVWHNDDFSFSITFSEGISFDEYEKVIVSIQK